MFIIILGTLSDSEKDLVNQIFKDSNIKLYNISFQILHLHSDAEEAVSQTFLKIINHIEKITKLPCPEIAPYCVVIVKNESANILRKRMKIVLMDEVIPLAAEEIPTLAQKISSLPLEYMNTLFFRYCFDFSPEDTDAMLETTHSVGRLRYVRNVLSIFMGLDGALVDDHSMKLACETALSAYVARDTPNVLQIPKYSNAFRRKLKTIKVAHKSTNMVITLMKRVAVFILVCAISFSTALVANAKFRERFLNWVVETFPKFSIFTTQTTESPVAMVLNQDDIVFGYLPVGYKISDTSQGRNMLKYNFLSGNENKQLTISFIFSEAGIKSYLNTEDAKVQHIYIKNSEAYTWKTDKMTYFLWGQGNIKCQMFGDFDYNGLIKIAENVEF